MNHFFLEHSEYFDSVGQHHLSDLTMMEAFASIQDRMQKTAMPPSPNQVQQNQQEPQIPDAMDTAARGLQHGTMAAVPVASTMQVTLAQQAQLAQAIKATLSEVGVSGGAGLEKALMKAGNAWPRVLQSYLKNLGAVDEAVAVAKKFPATSIFKGIGKGLLQGKGPVGAVAGAAKDHFLADRAGKQLAEKATKMLGTGAKDALTGKTTSVYQRAIPSSATKGVTINPAEALGFASGAFKGMRGQEKTTGEMFGNAAKTVAQDALIGGSIGAVGGALTGAGAIAGATAALPAAALAGAGYLAGRTGAEGYRMVQDINQAKANEAQATNQQSAYDAVNRIKQQLSATMEQIKQKESDIVKLQDPNARSVAQQELRTLYQNYYNNVKQVQQLRHQGGLYSRQQWTKDQTDQFAQQHGLSTGVAQ